MGAECSNCTNCEKAEKQSEFKINVIQPEINYLFF